MVPITFDGAPLSFSEYLSALCEDPRFAEHYRRTLLEIGGHAFFWEHPALIKTNLNQPAQVALIPAPELLNNPLDSTAFLEHYRLNPGRKVVRFPNLSDDATLIAPRPTAPERDFGHLSAFLRHASLEETQSLWREMTIALKDRLSQKPLWINTSGLGVQWLHLRIDSRPKYYQYAPFRAWP